MNKEPPSKAQPSHYILIAADAHKSLLKLPSAFEVAISRLKSARWGFNQRTRNRSRIKAGDDLLIYASGKRDHGMSFVGFATILSPPQTLAYSRRGSGPLDETYKDDYFTHYAQLGAISFFSKPVPIKPLLRKLSFIKSPDNRQWALPLVGGTLAISKDDYNLVKRSAPSSSRLPSMGTERH